MRCSPQLILDPSLSINLAQLVPPNVGLPAELVINIIECPVIPPVYWKGVALCWLVHLCASDITFGPDTPAWLELTQVVVVGGASPSAACEEH